MLREKFVSKLGFEPQIFSFSRGRSTIEPLETHIPPQKQISLSPILLQTKNTVFFVRKLHYYIYSFHFISTSYDTHLQTRRSQSPVLGKCRSVPPSIFVWSN